MTQPAKHTPTPLIVGEILQEGEGYYLPICYGQKNVFDGRYINIAALVPVINPSDKKYAERAAYIVKAVNSHAKLSEACKLIAAGGGDIDLLTAQEVARAAIAEAEAIGINRQAIVPA